ncbi:hypothetical protein CJ030_MR3G026651 [Morella rubra]|uniref:Uncharacterized protein n=1 Tax=Morella rubra TaxID=262757 RepID=A0A6A1W0Q5_9ROSI|nr:hypothetical protein CJ030_MR3G026651 [Morella rubra]
MAKTLVSHACLLAILFVFTLLAYAAELPPHYPVTPEHHHQGGKQTVHEDGARLEAEAPSHYPVAPDDHQGGNQQTVHEDGALFEEANSQNASSTGYALRPEGMPEDMPSHTSACTANTRKM